MDVSDSGERPGRLTVGLVGVGRVGSIIGAALNRVGHTVVAASGASDASRRRARDWLPNVPVLEPPEVVARADLAVLTVPDGVLSALVQRLADTDPGEGATYQGKLIVHTSGRHGCAVLDPLTRIGALPLALHPVMTFTGRGDDAARLDGCFFGVTAPEPLRPIAEALVVEMGGEPTWVAESCRPLYHAALASAANHLVTLVAESVELLRGAGIAEPERTISPLLGAALDNALRSGAGALTGPVARGDAETVASHVTELRSASPEAVTAYVAMARLTADRALRNGMLDPRDAERLLDVLAGPGRQQ